ncbi:MAG: coiled-coil domain-containing protein [Bacteroidota bacterium]
MMNNSYIRFFVQMNFLALALLLLSTPVRAQNVTPEDGEVEHNDKDRPCLVVNVEPEPKPLKKAWKSYLKDHYNFKIKGIGFLSNKDMLSAEDVIIEKLSSKRLDFYTIIVEDKDGSEMKVFASFGYDVYVNEDEMSDEYDVLLEMLNGFLKEYLPEYYEDKVKVTEKEVKNLTKDVEGLKGDISDNNDDIEDMKSEIEDLKEEIEELSEEVTEKEEQLTKSSTKLEERKEKLKSIKKQLKRQ